MKTGKYVMSFLNHLKMNLGVHAVVFVTYQDQEEKLKISEWVSWLCTCADSDAFLALSLRGCRNRMSLGLEIFGSSRNSGTIGGYGQRRHVSVLNTLQLPTLTECILKCLGMLGRIQMIQMMIQHLFLLRWSPPKIAF